MATYRIGYLETVPHEAFLKSAAEDAALVVERIPLGQPEAAITAALRRCHGYYVKSSRDELPAAFRVSADFLARMPQLLLVVTHGAGYDTVDIEACTRAGVAVVNQAGGNAEGVAQHAVGMMLALLKRMPETHAALKAGALKRREAFMGRELTGRTVGLVGIGHVGARTAQILAAFSCRVIAYDPYVDAETCKARGARKVELAALLAEADVVSVHCPLTRETRGMFGREAFAAMRAGAVFVTTARGSIHDEAALQEALASGHLAAAGLDVWEKEPPAADHPLLAHPAVIASPHMAGVTQESRARVARMAAGAFSDAAAGRPLPRLVNPAVRPRYAERRSQAFHREVS